MRLWHMKSRHMKPRQPAPHLVIFQKSLLVVRNPLPQNAHATHQHPFRMDPGQLGCNPLLKLWLLFNACLAENSVAAIKTAWIRPKFSSKQPCTPDLPLSRGQVAVPDTPSTTRACLGFSRALKLPVPSWIWSETAKTRGSTQRHSCGSEKWNLDLVAWLMVRLPWVFLCC